MDEVTELLNKIKSQLDGGLSDSELNRQLNAIYSIYASAIGPEQLIVQASRYNAVKYIHDESPRIRLIGMARLILESRDYHHQPQDAEIPILLDKMEEKLAEILSRQAVEKQLEEKITARLEERHQEYVEEIRREIIEEETESVETPESKRRLEKLEALDKVQLTRSVMQVVRPEALSEIIGQEEAVEALASRIASPYPEHLLLYGPPGVGKTTAARLVLEEAKKRGYTVFRPDAPFIECDGTTLQWDSRNMTDPLIGSVHDPIYQGARQDLADEGIPEPKPGLVTEAHGGILFLDEIGELDPILLNKLLKVLEDKKVRFESAYYDEEDPLIPAYIRKLFKDGAPADFILIGATTRSPEEINPAIRSRCAEIYFAPLEPEHIISIVNRAAKKLSVHLENGVAELISRYTTEGRKAVNLLADAYGLAVYEKGNADAVTITKAHMTRAARVSRLALRDKPKDEPPRIGRVYGLGVMGYWGSTLEIEAAAFPADEKGKGTIRFNDTAGSMAKDSVAAAASVVRRLTGIRLTDYDLHINVVGGGNMDGPSAGVAITAAILSAIEEKPLRQDVAVTGEISLSGEVKPVGGIPEKIFGARQAGMKAVILPKKNHEDVPGAPGLTVCEAERMEEVMGWLSC